jgi:GntR family transcriptional regulator
MISVKMNKNDPTDRYEQVAAEIRRAIADGQAKPGKRLPPAKDLAAVLGVNTNTVLRSLRLLRDEDLLEFRRGRGTSVAGTPERGAVVQRAKHSSASRSLARTGMTTKHRSASGSPLPRRKPTRFVRPQQQQALATGPATRH